MSSYRIWEPPNSEVPERPPVCIVACSWYPQIKLQALACQGITVDEFLCGLQLPDTFYRVLTGNKPTRIYIGSECRILNVHGGRYASQIRHVSVALRKVTERAKCTLLFPDQYLNVQNDTLVELVCCGTIAPTKREVYLNEMEHRPLSTDEENRFLATQHANSCWLWSRSLIPLQRRHVPPKEDLQSLPPWRPPRKLQWTAHSMQLIRTKRSRCEAVKSELSNKRSHLLESNLSQINEDPATIDAHRAADNRHSLKSDDGHIDTTVETANSANDRGTNDGQTPAIKSTNSVDCIIKCHAETPPADTKSPHTQSTSKPEFNGEMTREGITCKPDMKSSTKGHIQHISNHIEGTVNHHTDYDEHDSITKDLFHQHDSGNLPAQHDNGGLYPRAYTTPRPEHGTSDNIHSEIRHHQRMPLLTPRQPASTEAEINKVWSDDDGDAASNNPFLTGSAMSGTSSASSSSSSSLSSGLTSSSSTDTSSESSSSSSDSEDEAATTNIEDSIEQKIAETHEGAVKTLPPVEGESVEAQAIHKTSTDSILKEAITNTARDVKSSVSQESIKSSKSDENHSSDKSSTSDSGSSSNSESGSDSSDSTSIDDENANSIASEQAINVTESVGVNSDFGMIHDYQTPEHIDNKLALGSRGRRKPLLSSKRKIII